MIYLTGALHASLREGGHFPDGLGLLVQPESGMESHTWKAPWAADNGCFNKGDQFDPAVWLAWLDSLPRVGCLFAAAPDVVGDAAATLRRSPEFLPAIRQMDFPAAYVAQDGFWNHVPDWDTFDCLFIGGSTEFKESEDARRAATEAKRRGKWVHMGRVNSYRRLSLAAWWGCDSADGTFLKFGPDVNLPRLRDWLRKLSYSPFLEAS